jgi:hypothetical protein
MKLSLSDGSMHRSHLVQRLKKPFPNDSPMARLADTLAFGGGLRNGGLSAEAMGLLGDIFRFDYMGGSEFEWGAVPEALQHIAKNVKKYKAFQFTIPLACVAKDFRDKSTEEPTGYATIYVICDKSHVTEVGERIVHWAANPYGGELKETTHLSNTLRPVHEWDTDVQGWLELDNGFFFFTDRDMWEKTAQLFGMRIS